MLTWNEKDRKLYREYLEWKVELSQLRQARWGVDRERISDLEEHIKIYLKGRDKATLRDIILCSLDIEPE